MAQGLFIIFSSQLWLPLANLVGGGMVQVWYQIDAPIVGTQILKKFRKTCLGVKNCWSAFFQPKLEEIWWG